MHQWIVWLYDADGTATDYQFSRWHEAIAFMCSLRRPKWAQHTPIQNAVEWELQRQRP